MTHLMERFTLEAAAMATIVHFYVMFRLLSLNTEFLFSEGEHQVNDHNACKRCVASGNCLTLG